MTLRKEGPASPQDSLLPLACEAQRPDNSCESRKEVNLAAVLHAPESSRNDGNQGRHTEAAITFRTDFFHCDCSNLLPCRPNPPLTRACGVRVARPFRVDATAGSTGPTERRLPTPNAGEGVFREPLMSTFCLLQRCHRLTDRSLTRGQWEWFPEAPKASDGRGCRAI